MADFTSSQLSALARLAYGNPASRPAMRRYLQTPRLPTSSYRRFPVRKYAKRYITHGYPSSRGVQGELKSVDTTLSTASTRPDTTGDVILLNGIARGDDINERVGRRVTIRSLEAHLYDTVTKDTGVDQVHRVLIVYDMQSNGTAPVVTDVLVSASTTSLKNLDNRNRFRILYDQAWTLNASGESDSQKHITKYMRVNLPVQFNSGDAGTIADIQTGSIYFICLGSEVRGNTAGSINGRVRVRYSDN